MTKVASTQQNPLETSAEVLVLGLFSDLPFVDQISDLKPITELLDSLVEGKHFEGKIHELVPLHGLSGVNAKVVYLLGLGEKEKFNTEKAFSATSLATKSIGAKQRGQVVFALPDSLLSDYEKVTSIQGAYCGCRGQDIYKNEKSLFPVEALSFYQFDENLVLVASLTAQGIQTTRNLVNQAPNMLFPESFAKQIKKLGSESGFEVEIWDEERLRNEDCGALLGVAQGSRRSPYLVIMRHHGGPSGQQPLALVGKGVTFDSGGLSLKPSDAMLTMKCDMGGAATVVGIMEAIARQEVPTNVVGVVGLVENMPDGNALKLGDILTAKSGKTIEIHNTDAEGRLVLADALCVAREQNPTHIIDFATLTGACVVALGLEVSGLMTNNQELCQEVLSVADTVGEPAWQLPMFDSFGKQIQGKIADIKNVGEGRWGGAITAAKFLEEFVEETPWLHIDIAGPAFLDSPKPHLDGGGTGCMVRTLVEVIRNRS
ncbi:MAG: leucyl aminopeptidase [Pirellulaceae bacterium]|nr:leucyl aminopeptidase [Pirellulaceae bacterium]